VKELPITFAAVFFSSAAPRNNPDIIYRNSRDSR
jgi:hypothetical protein